jgi:hypothetical protein
MMADQTNRVAFKTNQTYNRTENKSCQDDGRSNKQGGIRNIPQTYNRIENKSRQDDGRSNKQGGIQNKPQTYNRTENKSR